MAPDRGREIDGSSPRLADGEEVPEQELFLAVYRQLHAVARGMFRRERRGHTLQPTALVHEAYLRLASGGAKVAPDKSSFLPVAARAMRRVLVEHARRRGCKRRGGRLRRITLDAAMLASPSREVDVLALEEALKKLSGLHERQARVVELRLFGGLTSEEAAEALGIGLSTAQKDWTMARAFLTCALQEQF